MTLDDGDGGAHDLAARLLANTVASDPRNYHAALLRKRDVRRELKERARERECGRKKRRFEYHRGFSEVGDALFFL